MLRLGPKAYLFRQGDPPTSAFLIEEGHVEIVLECEGAHRVLAVRGPGDIVGEMAIVDKIPRSASVRAIDDCVVFPITAAQLERRMAHADPITRMVLNVVLNRFRATLSEMRGGHSSALSSFFHHDPTLINAAAAELRMERDIDDALKRDEIEPFYQPIVRLADGKLVGFEALARWVHPVRGLIPPSVFVPIMEANGRSADLTLHCMQHVSRDLPLFMNSALSNIKNVEPLHVNLNVSAHDFDDEKLIEQLAEIAGLAGISTSDIHLELTESGLVRTPDGATSALQTACNLGFNIAIDDFGTGYSTMTSVRTTPANTLKIDRSFVDDLSEGSLNLTIVGNILQLAKSLGMNVVAEGIESAADASVLEKLGCDFGQGFAFGRPQPIEHCTALVRSWRRSDEAPRNAFSSQLIANIA